MSKSPVPLTLIFALALTMMLGPFSLDTYLPAFPSIGSDLGVGPQAVALSVSVYIFTIAFSQLLGGAFSDRFGRRQILVTGLVVYTLASFLIAAAQGIEVMLGGRVVQAFGAGWVLVSVPALVRDRVAGREAAKLFSLIGFIMVCAPAVAPSIGNLLLQLGSWRFIFLSLAAYAIFLVPMTARFIFRGLPTAPRSPVSLGFLARYRSVLGRGPTFLFVVWQSAGFSAMMIFVTNASFIYQDHFQQSETAFSMLFAANIVAMLGFLMLNRILLSRMAPLHILQMAASIQLLGMLGLVLASLGDWGVYAFVPPMMLTIGAMGAISPNIQACYLEYFPESGGTAAALLGSFQFFCAGLLSAGSTLLPQTLAAVVLAMVGCGVVCLLMLSASLVFRRKLLEPVPVLTQSAP